METANTGTELEAGQVQSDPGFNSGQPDGSQTAGEPQAGAEPSGEYGPESKSYKEIQAAFTRASQEAAESRKRLQEIESRFSRHGGVDHISQLADQLAQDKAFQEWIESRNKPQDNTADIYKAIGVDPEADPDSAKAVDTVAKINELVTQRMIENNPQIREMQAQLSQAREVLQKAQINALMGELRKNPEFEDIDDYRDKMAELSERLSPQAQQNPTLGDLQALYFAAVNSTGKMTERMAQAQQRMLEKKKAQSQDSPEPPAGESGKKEAKTIEEAFKAALRTHNIKL